MSTSCDGFQGRKRERKGKIFFCFFLWERNGKSQRKRQKRLTVKTNCVENATTSLVNIHSFSFLSVSLFTARVFEVTITKPTIKYDIENDLRGTLLFNQFCNLNFWTVWKSHSWQDEKRDDHHHPHNKFDHWKKMLACLEGKNFIFQHKKGKSCEMADCWHAPPDTTPADVISLIVLGGLFSLLYSQYVNDSL